MLIRYEFLLINMFTLVTILFISDQDERRLHDLCTKTKTISQKLVEEMNSKRKDLSRVSFLLTITVIIFCSMFLRFRHYLE